MLSQPVLLNISPMMNIPAVFSSKSFSGKTFLPVKNSYLLTFADDTTEILAACPFKSHRALFLLDFVNDCFDFLTNTHFVMSSS